MQGRPGAAGRHRRDRTVNRVLLTGRLTRDPEMRVLASGKSVATFTVATNDYRAKGQERAEYHPVVTWDRLAEICAQYIGKGQQVAIEGRLQTRQWEDEHKVRHWKTEVVASSVEMLSGRRKRDYATEAAAGSLEAQAARLGVDPAALDAADEAVPSVAADEPLADDQGIFVS
jgi:single-strand DNA-binding protein